MSMYDLYLSELKASYRYVLINMAITCWKAQDLDEDVIVDKIDKLEVKIDRASKGEFVNMYQEYIRRANLVVMKG